MIGYFLYKEKYDFSYEEKAAGLLSDFYFFSWVVGSTVAFMTSQPPAGFGFVTLTNVSALDGILVAGLLLFYCDKID